MTHILDPSMKCYVTPREPVPGCLVNTMTVREQHPKSHNTRVPPIQTHPAVKVGFELARVQFYAIMKT